MPKPIQQRRGQLLPQDLPPFAKGESTGKHRGALTMAFGSEMKE
jgi:hypothetical protein